MAQRVKKPAMEQPIKLVRAQTLYEHNGRVFKNEPYVHNGGQPTPQWGLVAGSRRFMSRKDRHAGHIGTARTNHINA